MKVNSYQNKKDGAVRGYDVKNPRGRAICIIFYICCILLGLACLFPAFWVFAGAFKDIKEFTRSAHILPESFDFAVLLRAWEKMKFAKYFINSGIVVAGYCLVSVLINGLTAYGLAVLKPKGHRILYTLIMLCLLVPSTGSIIALYVNINRIGLAGSLLPLWLSAGANAFNVILFKQFFESLPREVLEAAQIDGCGRFRMFMSIVLPLSKPIMFVVLIFAMNAAWSDFLMPYLLLNNSPKRTVMVFLYEMTNNTHTNNVDMIQAILFAMIPPTILFAIFQRKITDGAAGGAVKG